MTTTTESQMRYGKFGVGLTGSAYLWQSDLKSSDLSPGAAVTMSYSFAEHWGIRSSLGMNAFLGKSATTAIGNVSTSTFHANLYASYDFMPHDTFNPFVFAGGGLIYFDPRTSNGATLTGSGVNQWDINYLAGIGFDYFFDEYWSLTVSVEGALTNTDQLDGAKRGGANDAYQRISIGVRYHFFDRDFVKRMIEAFEKRGK